MKPEEQRIAIAEACGWRWRDGQEPCYGGTYSPAGWTAPSGDFYESDWHAKSVFRLPDYLNDLNAMHEAEKVLNHDQQVQFSVELGKLVTWHMPASGAAWMDYAISPSTAAQRAEAFLRTLNFWTI